MERESCWSRARAATAAIAEAAARAPRQASWRRFPSPVSPCTGPQGQELLPSRAFSEASSSSRLGQRAWRKQHERRRSMVSSRRTGARSPVSGAPGSPSAVFEAWSGESASAAAPCGLKVSRGAAWLFLVQGEGRDPQANHGPLRKYPNRTVFSPHYEVRIPQPLRSTSTSATTKYE